MAARNPPWTRDEHILALDFYFQHHASIPDKKSEKIIALSRLLNELHSILGEEQSATFRNPAGVYMKLMNFRSKDPSYPGVGLANGSKGEQEVWDEFSADPKHLAVVANSIAQNVDATTIKLPPEPDDTTEASEGRLLTRIHTYRERDTKLAKKKKDAALKRQGHLSCEACGFDFVKTYGSHGEGFIECHHTKPVSELAPGEKTKLTDLALLCSNCHRMIHKKRPWLSVEELKKLINKQSV